MDMDERVIKDAEYNKLKQYETWYLELLEVIYGERPEGENERPDPREVVKAMRTRGDLYFAVYSKAVAASLWLHDDPVIKANLPLGKSVLVDGLPLIRAELARLRNLTSS